MKRVKKFFYISSKVGVNTDQSWKEQNEHSRTNEVYALVNFTGGGKLIELWDQGGKNESQEEKKKRLLDYAENELKPTFFYLNEEDIIEQEVDEREAKKYSARRAKIAQIFYKHKANNQSHPIDIEGGNIQFPSMVSLDSIIKPHETHRASWNIMRRGAVGETPLHLLFLNNTPKHLLIAKYLLERYPSLALDIYEGADYYGESCLHFAIIQHDLASVIMLLKTGKADVHARAKGKFFMPTDVKRGTVRLKKHKYSGYAYYGEFPLSFAASIGDVEIYDELIKYDAGVNKKDRFGNTVLHLTVVHNQLDMFRHAMFHKTNPADITITNEEGLTPPALAAKLGRLEMTRGILDLTGKEFWKFSNMVCVAYPLALLDTFDKTGETNWKSTLMQIIEGDTTEHLDMLQIGAVSRLVDEKWKTFGRAKFIRLFLYQVMHLICLSCAVYLRPSDRSDLLGPTNSINTARYVFEISTALLCIIPLIFGVIEVILESAGGFLKNIQTMPSRLLYYCGCLLIIACVPFRLTRLYVVEEWLLVFAIPCIWSYLLFFARGWNVTGPFVTMIYRMLYTDIARFAFIYAVLLLTSSVAFFYQFEGQNVFAFLTELGTFMTLFQMSLGEFDEDSIKQGKYPALSRILFIVYMMLVHILLLNMLIAMMTSTYEEVAERTRKEWHRQWASITIILERSRSVEERLHIQAKYSTNIKADRVTESGDASATSGEVKFEDRALLLVKDSGTSVSSKKRAIKSTWKRMGKEAMKQHRPQSKTENENSARLSKLTVLGKSGVQAWMSGALNKKI